MSTETERIESAETAEPPKSEADSPPPESTDTAAESNVDSAKGPRRRSRVFSALLGVCVLAVVVGGVLGGMAWHAHSTDVARQSALDAGNKTAGVLLSYDFRDLDRSMDARTNLLTGEFRDRYRDMIERTVLPAAVSKQLTTTAKVVASSVVDGSTDRVTVLLFVNQSSATPTLPKPVQTGSRVEMTLEKHEGRWLTSDLKPV